MEGCCHEWRWGCFFSAVTAAELTRLQVLCKRKIRAHTALKLQVLIFSTLLLLFFLTVWLIREKKNINCVTINNNNDDVLSKMVTLFQAHRPGRLDFPMTALCPELPKFSWQGLKHSKTNVFWVVLDCLPCDKTLTFIYFSFNTGTSRLYKDGMMNYKTLNVFKIETGTSQSKDVYCQGTCDLWSAHTRDMPCERQRRKSEKKIRADDWGLLKGPKGG